MPDALRIHFIGDETHFEFAEACKWMREQCRFTPSSTLSSATINRVHNDQPHWIVIAQARPGQFRQREIDQLREAAPLATVIALLGSLCEGETRTGTPWAGVIRVYWHQWIERAARQKLRFEQREPNEWTPLGEFSLLSSDRPNEQSTENSTNAEGGLIVIAACDAAAYQSHAALFHQRGYATVWRHPTQQVVCAGALLGVWVGAGATAGELTSMGEFAEEISPTPWLALLNYPRYHDIARVRELGAEVVLGKPIRNDDLLAFVARLAIADRVAESATE